MATNFTLGDICELKIYCVLGDQCSINTVHYRVDSSTGVGITDIEAATALDAALAPYYKPLLSSAATYRGVTTRNVNIIPLPIYQESIAATGPGLSGPIPLPAQTSGVISSYTGDAGRKGRGRTYVPFPSTLALTAPLESPNAAYVAALGTLAFNLYGGAFFFTGAGGTAAFSPVLWSKKDPFYVYISQWVGRNKWGTQRRRGDYGRPNASPI